VWSGRRTGFLIRKATAVGFTFNQRSTSQAVPEGAVGIQHIYANGKALEGVKTGKYADGAIVVMDRMNYTEDDKKIMQEGVRKALLIMVKDEAKYKDTGGWGFEGFKSGDANQRLVKDGGKACFTCHAPLTSDNFVFSKLRN